MLLLLLFLVTLGFGLATSLTAHYSMAVRGWDNARGEWLARAAVAEFICRCQALQQNAQLTSIPKPLLQQIVEPTLIQPGPHFPGTVTLLLSGPHPSLDNSLSSLPACGPFDLGVDKSVPPYSYDLSLQVQLGGRSYLYEAFVQQRWPYALAGPGPITICGTLIQGQAPTRINGKILACPTLADPNDPQISAADAPLVLTAATLTETFRQYMELLEISTGVSTYGNLVDLGGPSTLAVLGPPVTLNNVETYQVSESFDSSNSGGVGAVAQGDIDLYPVRGGSKVVNVRPGNSLMGGVHVHDSPLAIKVSNVFDMPTDLESGSWQDVTLNICGKQGAAVVGHNVVLCGDSSFSDTNPDDSVIAVPGGKALFNGDLTLQNCKGLRLESCSLAVKGNLNLLGNPPGSVEFAATLQGSNASLVVTKDLIVENGQIDAGSGGSGMVILAKRFFIGASGNYNGLIVGQAGGTIFLPTQFWGSHPSLHIQGGILVAGNSLSFKGDCVQGSGRSTLEIVLPERFAPGISLIATQLDYAPQYMRGIHQFGNFELVGLNRR